MPRHASFTPKGVIPAVILPFKADLVDRRGHYRKHLRDVVATPGLSAITVNAHSTEAASCTLDEQKRVMAITQDEVGAKIPIVHGVYADGSLEGARIARQATEGGASALLVFPPGPFTMGHRPAMVIEHFKRIADQAGDVPLDRLQLSAGHQPGLHDRDDRQAGGGRADGARHQGLVQQSRPI